ITGLITGLTGTPIITSWPDTTPYVTFPLTAFFSSDTVLLNFGQFVNQRLYSTLQAANAIPFPTARTGLPTAYVGLTNQQLWDIYGIAIGGAIAPSTAFTAP